MKRQVLLASYGVALWVGLSLFYALTHFYLLGQFVITPPFVDVLTWKAASHLPWVPFLPLTVWLAARIPPLQKPFITGILSHTGIALVLAVLHMFWFAFVSILLVPYPSMADMTNAMNYFGRYVFIVDILYYAVLVAMTINVNLQGFRATQEGLLRSSSFISHGDPYFTDSNTGVESRPSPVLVYDPDSLEILAVNPACVDAYGYPSSTLTSMTLHDLTDTPMMEDFIIRMNHAKSMSIWLGASRHVRASGEPMDIEYINQRVLFSGDIAMMLLVNDVTDQLRAKRDLEISELRTTELRAQLADARLRALKLQLKPHFLFNLLNTVSMMIRNRDYAQAQQVVTLLGEMFRNLLAIESEDMITLDDELRFVGLFMELQRFRFEERLEFHMHVDESLRGSLVPAMILQPVVENAVKHGVSNTSGVCSIELKIHEESGMIITRMTNDFDPHTAHATGGKKGHGIGVSNTKSRLLATYGGRANFELVQEDGRMHAILELPLNGHRAGLGGSGG